MRNCFLSLGTFFSPQVRTYRYTLFYVEKIGLPSHFLIDLIESITSGNVMAHICHTGYDKSYPSKGPQKEKEKNARYVALSILFSQLGRKCFPSLLVEDSLVVGTYCVYRPPVDCRGFFFSNPVTSFLCH